tara:strand:- start:2015 stop:2482 length:468 start_codon:yes stop_codon:yes gene_type:complete
MIKINVITNNSNWYRYIKNPNNYIDRKVYKLNLSSKKFFKKTIFCTLLLSGDKEIKSLNSKFRKKNKATDVLSFPFQNKNELKKNLNQNKEIYLGDIIVSLDQIKRKKVLKYFKIEFDKLWIHGLVHLLGFDHKKDQDFYKMNRIEKKYTKIIYD